MTRLEDRVAIVTGGAQGIGRAYVERLAEEGAKVVIADVLGDIAQATAAALSNRDRDVVAFKTDVADEAGVNALAAATMEKYGRIDILVNNAALFVGILPPKPFDQIDVKEWDRVMAVNVRGIFLCCKAVFPYMKAQGKGKIINISSGTFWKGTKGLLHYISSKGAVVGLTRALASEVGEFGINVNAITPGLTASEGVVRAHGSAFPESFAARRSIKRKEVPEDLVGTVVFLASDDSDFITGQTINVDGGEAFH